MIDEKKLIAEIEDVFCADCTKCQGSCRFGELVETILRQPKIGEWIPCNERLPEKSGYYLYFAADAYGGLQDGVGVSYYQHKVKKWKKVYTPRVTHWQPLPEPYRGE